MAIPVNINRTNPVPSGNNPTVGAVRPKESFTEIRDRMDAGNSETYSNAIFDDLLHFSYKAGFNMASELNANKERALICIKEIRAKYPGKSNKILGAYSRLILSTVCYLDGKSAFDVELSLLMEANKTVASLLEANALPADLVAGINDCLDRQQSYDARGAFCDKYGVELDIFPWEMTEREKAQIAESGIIPPPQKDDPSTRRSNNILVREVEGIFARYPSQMYERFPKRIAVGRYVTGETYKGYGPKERSMFSGVKGGLMDHELFHWFKDSDEDMALESSAIWLVASGMLTQEQINGTSTGYVCGYGKTNIQEDQATIAQMLFTSSLAALKARLAFDPILRKKVELITGCEYDVEKGVFTKLLTKSDRKKKFGIGEPLFYARWSNDNGKVLMDADYWNNILQENQNGAN